MPCVKGVSNIKFASLHWSAARSEERPQPWSTAIFGSAIGLNEISFVRAAECLFKTLVFDAWRT